MGPPKGLGLCVLCERGVAALDFMTFNKTNRLYKISKIHQPHSYKVHECPGMREAHKCPGMRAHAHRKGCFYCVAKAKAIHTRGTNRLVIT